MDKEVTNKVGELKAKHKEEKRLKMTHPKLLEIFKFEFKGENNGIRS